MLSYVQFFIGLIFVSLVIMYGLLVVRKYATDKNHSLLLRLLIGISILWSIVAFIVSFESRISVGNYWLFSAANKSFYLLSLVFTLGSYYFVKIFPISKPFGKKYVFFERCALVASLMLAPSIVLGNSVSGSYVDQAASMTNNLVHINSTYSYRSGKLSILYGSVLIVILLATIFISLSRRLNARASRKQKAQSKIIVIGISLAIMFGSIFQLILPSLVEDYPNSMYTLGQLAPIFMTFSAYYAVFKYRLFDIKNSAFRAVGYSLSVATLVAIYSIVIYGILLPLVYPDSKFTITSLLLTTVGTATTVLFFDKIKVIFDAITDKLFFKNSYNLPKFLDDFNQALINSSDVSELASAIFQIMGDTLKTEFFILIVKHDRFEITIDSRKEESENEADAKMPLSMINYHFKSGERVILRDYLDRNKYEGLFETLDKADASAAIDLSESSKASGSLRKALESGNFKAMLLGPKRSGESYNAQDLDALRIISKELVVGLQNAMRFEEIKLFNLELQHKVDLATGKLRDQNKKLVVADELKDDFLSIASHQMRTPISAINGYASILSSGDAGKLNKNQQKFAKIIEDSTKRLSYLINDFLTVSRLKSGKFSIEKTDADLNKVLKSEVSNLTAQFKAKDVKLNVSMDEKLPIVKADESKIRQVMMNLIDNALYYTPAEGQVNVSLKKTSEGIIFEVKDSGIGVPKEDQPKLFSKMFRAGNAQKMRPDGTGLGLYLAKKVVLGHHGHIIFKSVENEGSTFGFRIPVK